MLPVRIGVKICAECIMHEGKKALSLTTSSVNIFIYRLVANGWDDLASPCSSRCVFRIMRFLLLFAVQAQADTSLKKELRNLGSSVLRACL